ncbi:MAG: nucleotide exchange factor GrpE [Armatimonadota bacterium]|nr:MAG: nucleotide exchange factor GrpE [Armatimonadota bacterium]
MKKRREDKAAEEPREEQGAASEEQVLPAEELVPEKEEEEAGEESEVEVLQQELALLETQLQDMRDRYIRSVADLDNVRKRARRAIGDARKQAVAGLLLELLTLVDDFERALETKGAGDDAPEEARAVYQGVELIYRQLMGLLERRGVRAVEAMGQPFDPSRHEAVAQIPATDEQKEGTVALEMQKGYLYGDEVLRHSRVGVAVHEQEKDE